MTRTVAFLTVLFFGVFNAGHLKAQQPFLSATDQPGWSVAMYNTGMPLGSDAFASSSSVDICGYTYSVVENIYLGGTAYFRNDGQRTLLRRSSNCADKEYLLYDFSLDVGDTTYVGWNMEGSSPDTSIAIIQGIDTVELLGIARKRFSLLVDRCPTAGETPSFTTMEWVEGIGSITHPFYSLICLCDFCETSTILQCADSSGTAIYRSSPDAVCDRTIGLDESTQATDRFLVFGTNKLIQLQYPSGFQRGELSIYDPSGRVVLTGQVSSGQNTYSLPELPSGIYTVVITRDKQKWTARWVLLW